MIFIKTLNRTKNIGLSVIAVLIISLYSYLVPGWDYLESVWQSVASKTGISFILFVLFIFYFFHFIILYQVLKYFFSQKISMDFINDDTVEIQYEKKNYRISKKELRTDQNKIILHSQDIHFTLYRNPFLSNVGEYQDFIRRLQVNNIQGNNTTHFDVSSFLIKNPKIKFFIFTVIGFLWMFFFRNIIQPYQNEIGMITRTKNAFLEIITTLPFLLLYCCLVYAYFYYTAKIKKIELLDKELKFEGSREVILPKNSINEIHVIENSVGHKVLRILFYTENRNLYSLNFITPQAIQYISTYFKLDQLSPEIASGRKKEEIKKIFKL